MKKLSFFLLAALFVGCGCGGKTSGSGSPPAVTTLAPSSITSTSSTLTGTVISNGLETDAWFEWGTSSTLQSFTTTPTQAIGVENNSVAVKDNLTGLTTGQTYYFRAAARNALGTVKGNIASFIGGGGSGKYYSTDFNLTEYPISEGGKWINGRAVGLDWYNVITSGGIAYGDYSPSTPMYTDPTAVLTGSWGPNQTVEATVYSINQNASYYQEVELRLRSSITAHSITGYEVLFRCLKTSAAYASIGRWNGPLGNFTDVTDSAHFGSQYGVQDGDVVKATVTGTNPVIVRAYINNVLIMTATDSSPYRIQTGNPGVGFDFGVGNTNTDFGFKNFTATDNIPVTYDLSSANKIRSSAPRQFGSGAGLSVGTLFIEPGSPWENGYIEAFNGKLREELLNREILKEARILIE